MTVRSPTTALLLVLLSNGCTVWPDSQSGTQTKSTSFFVGGYSPSPASFPVSFQQQDRTSGSWVTVGNATTVDASQLLPQLTAWYPWMAPCTPSADSRFWTDSTTFGGVVSTKMRSPEIPYSVSDLYVAMNCAFTVPPDSTGIVQPLTIATTCGDSSGAWTLHTCRTGPSSQPSSYDCGPAGYPGNNEHADLSMLTGVWYIDGLSTKLTGRSTDAQRTAVRTFLQRRLSSYGVTATLDNFAGGANVVGSLPQTTTGAPGKPILIGAHFDTEKDFTPGAADNGVGVVVMLDLANFVSTLSSRNRPVYFVAFDLEELDMAGSSHFLTTPTGQLPWHSVHLFDQISGASSNLNIEASSSLTDCMWNMYGAANTAGAFSIPLKRVTADTTTDRKSFVDAGIRAINVSTATSSVSTDDCIGNRSCDHACGGDCATGRFCDPNSCVVHGCICDSYQNINFEKVASVSLLARKTIQRILNGQDTSCPN